MAIERVVDTSIHEDDREEAIAEISLRPVTFDEYIGQKRLKTNLKLAIDAAKKRGDVLDHVLLYGPPGLGKTTMAGVIAHEMNANFRATSAPSIEKAGDLASIIVIGKGPAARSVKLDLPRFTLIGATTQTGNLAGPLRDRFGHQYRLEYYADSDIQRIIERSAKILETTIEPDAAKLLAQRSRLTPRIANRLLKRVRDFADVNGDGVINIATAKEALKMLEIDELGLDPADRNMLTLMIEKYGDKPVGLNTIAALTGDEPSTIENYYEPFLMQLGMIQRTPKGRMVTNIAREHLGLWPKKRRATTNT